MITIAIVNDTRITSHYGCMLVMENLLVLLVKNNVELTWNLDVSVDWRKHTNKILNKPKVVMDDAYCVLKGYDLIDYEGLVHGYFKQQNILNDFNKYKVIHCQYYTYGIGLRDLAFLYSKDERGFGYIKSNISRFLSSHERLLLVFFYLLASLINVKKKRTKKVIIKKNIPLHRVFNALPISQ
jgi:hypothetical protein